ncbi:MAG: glucose 1-dehydrogenase [Armatimonadetes bacterium]|nr:glucose 1-dehydrogenase [Armatimonadota bacterium]
MKLNGKVAVVTGGGTGLGRATCLALAREGAAVVVNYSRSQAEAEAVAEAIRLEGGQSEAVRADVSVDEGARALVSAAVERFGRLDILVNNAGYTRQVPHHDLDSLTEEVLDRTLAVNVKGPIYCMRAAIPEMQKNGGGAIINVTSTAGITGAGSSVIYGGSKAALTTITKSLARAFAPEVRVNTVAPGWVDTGFGGWPPGTAETVRQKSHIGRVVEPEDVAAMILFLVTDGDALTGQEIVVDGGTASLGPRG